MIFPVDKKRSIGEAAKEVGLPEHVIRFWETQFPDIQPTIGNGNRRYFYDRDIKILKTIKYYLYEKGFTIKGLQKLFKDETFNIEEEAIDNEKKVEKIENKVEKWQVGEVDKTDKVIKVVEIDAEEEENNIEGQKHGYINLSAANNNRIKGKLKVLKVKLNIFYEKLKNI